MAASLMPDDARNPFRLFWGLGYRRLVPIVPPDAELSPTSSLSRRPGSRGKAVGLRGTNGWYGFNWHVTVTTEEDLERWHAMGAGVGIRTGEGLVALDIDSLSDVWARRVTALAHEMLGPAPRRLGRAPKALLPYRVRAEDIDAVGYRVVLFDDGTGFDPAKRPRVELLSTGRQFVCEGIHPDTGQPYGWPEGVPAHDELTEVGAEQINAFFAALAAMLPDANAPRAGSLVTDRRLVDQDRLRGDARAIAEAIARIPNDVPDYDGYRNMATALRGALPDDPETGLDIFRTWSERWEDGKPDPDFDERTFRSVQPPFALGAPYLYAVASRCAGEVLTPPELFFAPIEDGDEPDTSAFGDGGGPGGGSGAAAASTVFEWIDPASWVGIERPEQRWFVKGLVPHGEVTLLTGKGGIGKSLVTLQMLTAIALGIPFLGRETTQARVMGMFCEDGEDVLHARQKDICLAVMHELSDLSPIMRLASRKYEDNLLSVWDRSSSSMRLSKVYAALERDVLAFGAKVVVLDTIADTFGGDEINRAQVRQFIQACAGRLAKAIDGAVILLGHPSRSGEQSGEGTSGSTAWHATVRSRLYLEETGKPGSGYRRLTSMKANYGPAGDSWVLKWQRGVLEPVSSSQTVAGAVSEAGVPETASVLERAVLKAVAEANADGVRMVVGKTSKDRVEPILRRRSTDSLMAFTPHEVEEAVLDLIAKGQIVEAPMGRDGSRRSVMSLTVCPPKPLGNVFD